MMTSLTHLWSPPLAYTADDTNDAFPWGAGHGTLR